MLQLIFGEEKMSKRYYLNTLSLPFLSKQQLYSVCKNMQTRVVELIPQLLDAGLIEELLVINDDLNNAFIRYERFELPLTENAI